MRKGKKEMQRKIGINLSKTGNGGGGGVVKFLFCKESKKGKKRKK